MAHQFNQSIPAMERQINADVPDIEENFGHIEDSFERIFQSWSTANGGNASAKFASATGFNDGTYNYEFPTNGVAAHSVIMLGTSDTIVWMYLNTAPPGWKALSTGADTVLAVAGGAGDYNVNGGNPDSSASWDASAAYTIANDTHNHQWYDNDTQPHTWASNGSTEVDITSASSNGNTAIRAANDEARMNIDGYTVDDTHNHSISSDSSWRPSASVGKLFQLDTA